MGSSGISADRVIFSTEFISWKEEFKVNKLSIYLRELQKMGKIKVNNYKEVNSKTRIGEI